MIRWTLPIIALFLASYPFTVQATSDDARSSMRLARRRVPLQSSLRIISRREWGADESIRMQKGTRSRTRRSPRTHNGQASHRVQECDNLQKKYRGEFGIQKKETHDEQGRAYRWPLSYSQRVRLLVVHHTALTVNGDGRSEKDRVRDLYTYHTKSLGWGDVGYNFIIGESGRIYEGRAGGDSVVAGHAYCHNIGSIGIALLGDFEKEQPTQAQLKSAQILLKDLAQKYNINVRGRTQFHGKALPTIVGHNDLNSTACPGHYLDAVLPQIRNNVASDNTHAYVKIPALRVASSKTIKNRTSARKKSREQKTKEPVTYSRRTRRSRRIVARKVQRNVRRKIITPRKRENPQVSSRLPAIASATGVARSSRDALRYNSAPLRSAASLRMTREESVVSRDRSQNQSIRIRLGYFNRGATIANPKYGERTCTYSQRSITRIGSPETITTITSWNKSANRFRGVIECRVIDGQLVLINELSLEDYLAGLAEEPDTEPYEKQRAFAIAARSYAAHYMESQNRKFPGLPYDGSDSPKEFQAYGGVHFEQRNPRWARAVHNTKDVVVTKNNTIVKTPYFSSSDGRTRSPQERGWNTFPFAEVFSSKKDPWCTGMSLRGHGVGMSGCGAEGQANQGKSAEEILRYYYEGTRLQKRNALRR
jgi:peptidoglycan hydrolase-like amidase